MRYLKKFRKWLSPPNKPDQGVTSKTSVKDPAVSPAQVSPAPAPAAKSALEYASTCYIPTSWMPLPLVNKFEVNHNTLMFEFGLPEGRSLDLPVCACLLLQAPGTEHESKGGGDAVRPYTPVSDSHMVGKFQLLIKVYKQCGILGEQNYRPAGAVSNYIDSLKIGDTAMMKHIKFNVKYPYPFKNVRTITMLCVGSGITPMIQALRKMLTTEGDQTQVVLLLG